MSKEKGCKVKKNPCCDKQCEDQNDPDPPTDTGYFDTYVIGKYWIDVLRAVLVGAKFELCPVVKAAAVKEQSPPKPPPMKYTELPLYDCPHSKYKQYLADKEKHPERNHKILQTALLPTVREYRKCFNSMVSQTKKELCDTYKEVTADMDTARKKLLTKMRDPNNLSMRQGAVVLGGLTGLYLTRRRINSVKLLGIALGSLVAGAGTFPKETDEIFRTVCYHAGNSALRVYSFINVCFNKQLRENTPCALIPVEEDKKKK